MSHSILLVDDQREVLRVLHAALDTLKVQGLQVFEAPSGEEALLESARHKIDLLITDYMLPGMSGVELIHKVRARHPEAKVVVITGVSERKVRNELLNIGAMAILDKPVPMADFLDAAERGLDLVQTIFPNEKSDDNTEERQIKISDLLANFRQDIKAEAVFLLNDHGLIQARTGKLRDDSMESSLISTLMAIHSASLKVAHYNHQKKLDSYHIFAAGDHDLLFIPVTAMHALLVAGNKLASADNILETVSSLLALRAQVEKSLASMGVTGSLRMPAEKNTPASAPQDSKKPAEQVVVDVAPSPEMEALLKEAASNKTKTNNADDFWNQAAEEHGNKPASSEVISLEEARKLGLIPGDGK